MHPDDRKKIRDRARGEAHTRKLLKRETLKASQVVHMHTCEIAKAMKQIHQTWTDDLPDDAKKSILADYYKARIIIEGTARKVAQARENADIARSTWLAVYRDKYQSERGQE